MLSASYEVSGFHWAQTKREASPGRWNKQLPLVDRPSTPLRNCFRRRRLRTATRCFVASASAECKVRTFEISGQANHHPTVGVCSTALGRYRLGLGGLDRQ